MGNVPIFALSLIKQCMKEQNLTASAITLSPDHISGIDQCITALSRCCCSCPVGAN
jgi:hypothetical protein